MPSIIRQCSLLAILATPTALLADSDGYFCIGSDYLAYEVNRPGHSDAHRLKVIVFDDSKEIAKPIEIPIPDFQVHRLFCTADQVRLVGWDAEYVVSWDRSSPANSTLSILSKNPGEFDDMDSELPASLSRRLTQKVIMHDPDSEVSFELVSTKSEIEELRCSEILRVSLVKRITGGWEIHRPLLAREVPKECGE